MLEGLPDGYHYDYAGFMNVLASEMSPEVAIGLPLCGVGFAVALVGALMSRNKFTGVVIGIGFAIMLFGAAFAFAGVSPQAT